MSTTTLPRRPIPAVNASSVTLVMEATPAAVPVLRAFTRQTVGRWNRGEDAVESLALIVTELVTNVCRHSGSSHVTVWLSCDDRQIDVKVVDQGSWRDPDHTLADEDADLHGRGLHLIRAYADTMEIRRTEGGTHVLATLLADASYAQSDLA
ncbi:ATP-binding protein [Streptomyces sp. NPDC059629]|uniref:ATP-binding protein n=1 Tax=Streptomyces sp. NPDC059629 TaxID=3346889 RepID=UPI003678D8F9